MIKMSSFLKFGAIIAAVFIIGTQAESHTVTFQNSCGIPGVPTLKANGVTLSTGEAYTSNGPLEAAIAYLDIGCGDNGEGCTTIETTLANPTSPGSGSSTDITLIPPHSFSVGTAFEYYNGCDGAGADCSDIDCNTALKMPTDTQDQIQCEVDNVNLAITFCDYS
ncbi:glycopeptide [Lentinula lateritia]|uniref:Glycopeptide n=1 Tax=Lentinula lateritia TaxID=40482 RepID=A0ABQ8VAP8_9AGAR|nr:glycopeptide [Lentinula lateritia]